MNWVSRELVSDKLLEKILDLPPVPTNFKEPPVLDDVTLNTLTALKKIYTVQKDNPQRASGIVLDAMGTFSRLWVYFESVKSGRIH